MTAGQTLGILQYFFLIFDSISTGSLLNICTCYFHTTNVQHFGQQDTFRGLKISQK